MPTKAPKHIGNKNLKLFFISLKNDNILSSSFSYSPVTIQITPLLMPGSIAPAPINIPLIKLTKLITYLSILKIKGIITNIIL